jgi:hypothetical protein
MAWTAVSIAGLVAAEPFASAAGYWIGSAPSKILAATKTNMGCTSLMIALLPGREDRNDAGALWRQAHSIAVRSVAMSSPD